MYKFSVRRFFSRRGRHFTGKSAAVLLTVLLILVAAVFGISLLKHRDRGGNSGHTGTVYEQWASPPEDMPQTDGSNAKKDDEIRIEDF